MLGLNYRAPLSRSPSRLAGSISPSFFARLSRISFFHSLSCVFMHEAEEEEGGRAFRIDNLTKHAQLKPE